MPKLRDNRRVEENQVSFRFEPIKAADLSRLHDWLNKPHVAERWGGTKSIGEVKEDYFSADGDEHVDRYIVCCDDTEIGYIQSYKAIPREGWWDGENAQVPGTVGIDFFIGEPEYLDKGIGAEMIKAFVKHLLLNASVTRVISDPSPDNPRSIRCLEKAGFHKVRQIVTPDGAAMLMETKQR